jgi:hypothetical protein
LPSSRSIVDGAQQILKPTTRGKWKCPLQLLAKQRLILLLSSWFCIALFSVCHANSQAAKRSMARSRPLWERVNG